MSAAALAHAIAISAIADVHCQICGRAIKAKSGRIAHHGYQRPHFGSGWQTASCLGARALPYEVSADLLPSAIAACAAWKGRVEERIASLAGTPTIANPRHATWLRAKLENRLRRSDGTQHPEPPATITFPGDIEYTPENRAAWLAAHEYRDALARYRREAARELEAATEELARLEARLAAWVPVTIASPA